MKCRAMLAFIHPKLMNLPCFDEYELDGNRMIRQHGTKKCSDLVSNWKEYSDLCKELIHKNPGFGFLNRALNDVFKCFSKLIFAKFSVFASQLQYCLDDCNVASKQYVVNASTAKRHGKDPGEINPGNNNNVDIVCTKENEGDHFKNFAIEQVKYLGELQFISITT